MAADNFFQKYSTAVIDAIQTASAGYQSNYASGVMTLATSAVALYVLWKGYHTMAGKSQAPLQDLAWDLTRFALIITFVTNAGGYLDSATSALQGLKEGFGSDPWASLDTLWAKAAKLADTIYNADTDTIPLAGLFGMSMTWIGMLILMLVGAVVYSAADITMLLLTVTAPIFIFCLMFGFLRTMFNNWLNLMFSSILTVLFAGLVINVFMGFVDNTTTTIQNNVETMNIVKAGAFVLAIGVLGAGLVLLAAKMAMQLSGVGVDAAIQGMALAGLGAAGFMTANAAMKGGRFGKGYYDGMKGNALSDNASASKRIGHAFGGKDKEAVKTAWQTSRAVMEKARKRVSNG